MRLTVVIPTFRRAALLGRVLDRLEPQAGEFEVVIARDAADDDPAAVERAAAGRAFPVRLVEGPTPGVAATRDAGWRAAETPLILFLGDDMLPRAGVVAEHLARHGRHPEEEVAVLGHVCWSPEIRRTTFMRWLDRGIQFDYGRIEGSEAGWGRFYAAHCSLKRELLERSGGFDHEFRFGYEELDLAVRLRDLGMRLIYAREAVAEHLHPPTLEGWRRRMELVAPAELRFVTKHPELRPWFHDLFSYWTRKPPPRGIGRRLAPLVPPDTPWLGPKVWASVDHHYALELAHAFLPAWEEAAGTVAPWSASASSSPR